MKLFLKLLSVFYFLINSYQTFAQTAGSGILSSIMAKANEIESNDQRIAELNRKHLQSYDLETQKLNKLKSQLRDLIKEKEIVLEDFRQGYFCGGCMKPRSQFGRGETFPHSGQSIVPASQEQIAAKEKEYDDKIEKLKQQIKEFESSENEFTRMRSDLDKQINRLKDFTDSLRNEIIELSKRYRDVVSKEAKNVALTFVEPLLSILANKHFIQDRINILIVKIDDLKTEEKEKIKLARDKGTRDISEKKNSLEQKKISKELQIDQLNLTFKQRIAPYKKRLAEIALKLAEIKRNIIARGLSFEMVQKLKDEQEKSENLYSETEKMIDDYEIEYNSQKNLVMSEIKEISDRIWWDYTVGATKILDSIENEVKNIYILKNKVLSDAKSAREMNLQTTSKLLFTERNEKEKKFMDYVSIVEQERIRLLRACTKAGCSCYATDISGIVNAIWKNSVGCVDQMDLRYAGSTYYGCQEEEAIYQRYYNSNINGLSDADLEALQRKIGKERFNILNKKLSN